MPCLVVCVSQFAGRPESELVEASALNTRVSRESFSNCQAYPVRSPYELVGKFPRTAFLEKSAAVLPRQIVNEQSKAVRLDSPESVLDNALGNTPHPFFVSHVLVA